MLTRTTAFSIALLLLAATAASSQSRLKAELACAETPAHLAYDCTVRITEAASGAAVEGLAVEIKADMPSMPMAHNIPPVGAAPAGEPGIYAFPITLDMFGSWAFSIRLSGPREDLLVEVLNFEAGDASSRHCHGEDCSEAVDHHAHE